MVCLCKVILDLELDFHGGISGLAEVKISGSCSIGGDKSDRAFFLRRR